MQAKETLRPNAAALFTIGYEKRSIEDYMRILVGFRIGLLCDLRRNALSRKPGFSKSALRKECERLSIVYEHWPELGIASEKRRNLKTSADRDALFLEYERDWLPRQTEALAKIEASIRQGQRVALTCFERDPRQCHRRRVAELLEKRLGKGSVASHL